MQENRRKQIYLKLCIIIVMVLVFSVQQAFAWECDWETRKSLLLINEFLTNLWKLASRIWIILWNLAGVLMTNTMVYWEFMHLDSFLWKIWQMSRSIANYTLWFLFLYNILKYIFYQVEKPPIQTIKDILVASIFIQASWFLVMVVVDLSTIGVATVSSFPAQVMVSSPDIMQTMKEQMTKSKLTGKDVIVINSFSDQYLTQANTKWYSIEKRWGDGQSNEPDKKIIDSLLPSASNMWWPFMYLWFTALEAQEYTSSPMPSAASCVGQAEKVFTNLIINSWILILYSLSLVFLIILLVMRLWYLWIFIAISPLIVLQHFMKIDKIKSIELFDLKKSLALIFQPVFFALLMSLMFIVVLMVQKLFSWYSDSSLSWGVIATDSPTSSSARSVATKQNSILEDAGLVSFYVREWAKSMKDVILSLIVLVLMWQFIKFALTWSVPGLGSNSSVSKYMGNLVNRTSSYFWSVWVVPTPRWMMWFNKVWNWDSSPLFDAAVGDLKTEFMSRDKSKDTINELMWWSTSSTIKSLTPSQKITLNNSYDNNENSTRDVKRFVDALDKIRENNKWLMFKELVVPINNWLLWAYNTHAENTEGYKQMNEYFWWTGTWKKIISTYFKDGAFNIEDILNDGNYWNKQYFPAFYKNVLGWTDDPASYQDFKNRLKWRISVPTSESS